MHNVNSQYDNSVTNMMKNGICRNKPFSRYKIVEIQPFGTKPDRERIPNLGVPDKSVKLPH